MKNIVEKIKNKLLTSPRTCKLIFNLWPPFLGTGIKVVSISDDFKDVKLLLKLRFYNKNYINTQFGGSLFAMTDPFFTFMLLKQLGKDYLICDQSASINYISFGKGNVKANLKLTDIDIQTIKDKTASGEKFLPSFNIEILDASDEKIISKVTRILYVKKRPIKTVY